MKILNTRKILYLRLIRPIFHLLLILLSFYVVYHIRQYTDLIPFVYIEIPKIDFIETMFFGLISGLIFLILSAIYNVYELFKPIHGYYKKFLKSWLAWFIAISFLAYFGHGYFFENGISRLILFWGSVFSLIIITIFDIIFNYINSYLESKNPYKILFIYTDKNFYDKIYSNFSFYKIYKIYGKDFSTISSDELSSTVESFDIIVTLGNFDMSFLQNISDLVRLKDKVFYHISESYFLEDLIYLPQRLGPILAFEYKPSPLDGWYRVFKRIFDISFSIIFILFFWWVYIGTIVFILVMDGRPVFYNSKRVGKSGRIFVMKKFRSMIKNADKQKEKIKSENERSGPLFKLSDDPRITWWGKLLRKTSIDELPQFINVLKGDMSVVGPRPHIPEEVNKYHGWHKRLLTIKPGITGYAQIFGRDNLDFDEEAKLDLYYIQNRSVFLDIYVIFTTFKVIFKGK